MSSFMHIMVLLAIWMWQNVHFPRNRPYYSIWIFPRVPVWSWISHIYHVDTQLTQPLFAMRSGCNHIQHIITANTLNMKTQLFVSQRQSRQSIRSLQPTHTERERESICIWSGCHCKAATYYVTNLRFLCAGVLGHSAHANGRVVGIKRFVFSL